MKSNNYNFGGDPDKTRTCYLLIRNQTLYPDELRDQNNAGISKQIEKETPSNNFDSCV